MVVWFPKHFYVFLNFLIFYYIVNGVFDHMYVLYNMFNRYLRYIHEHTIESDWVSCMSRKVGHRSKIDIMWAILDFIEREGVAGKTHVLYAANLNSRSLERFIDKLLGIGAINVEVIDGRSRYFLTSYGYKLLSLLTSVREILENKSLISVSALTNKAMSEIIRNKLKLSDEVSLEYGRIVYGESNLEYIADVIVSNTDIYIILYLSSGMNREDIANVLGKALLILVDTDLKCIFVISHSLNHVVHRFKNVLDKANIDRSRYMFIVAEEQWHKASI